MSQSTPSSANADSSGPADPPATNGELSHHSDFSEQINSASLAFIEQQFQRYQDDPQSLPAEWVEYFDHFEGDEEGSTADPIKLGPSFQPRGLFHVPAGGAAQAVLQERVGQYIRNVRVRGHIIAKIDPLESARPDPPELHPELHRIEPEDYNKSIAASDLTGGGVATFAQILERFRNTYCRSIGVQFMHIDSYFVRSWLQEKMESTQNRYPLDRDEQMRILSKLTNAVTFESFLLKKYVGAKTFSLEGAETLIPLLDLAIEHAGNDGIQDLVIGMAHRGRLNVLTNIMGKAARDIFREFDDADPEKHIGSWDVKYHLGYSNDYVTRTGKKVHLALCFNPSHLEFVNPVALGKTRAKQDRLRDKKRVTGLTILVHGDAAFAGEGVVQETLNLSELKGYKTGGTIHVIVNNQIGFTTNPDESRSSEYATDVAKMLQIPIFHVNGEDPEAVAQVVSLAMQFRKKFRRDVVIDMYCYRARGHNENDEPAFTQPVMYRKIEARHSVRQGYLEHLLKLGEVTREEADQLKDEAVDLLESELAAARADGYVYEERFGDGVWETYHGGPESSTDNPDTGSPRERIEHVVRKLAEMPESFKPHKTIKRTLKERGKMAVGETPFDWATAELAAFGTLALEKQEHPTGAAFPKIRLSGQDCRRGTFSQRHAVLYDAETGSRYHPLHHLAGKFDQSQVEIINSPLSEAGVLGFDYGYSLDCPNGLIIWEAQFGDFHNAGQVIIDQFITSGEDKWKRLSGIVMMLPHGFEGQGPEHSSARLERFMTMAAEDNMQIVQATTPAQHFHVLRRQVIRRWRKPLVLMTPKSLLRHKKAVSSIEELESGTFQKAIGDPGITDPKKVERILLCSGKVYYDLLERREELGHTNVPILRLEQLYPFPKNEIEKLLESYPKSAPLVWVQEEPLNMGAWRTLFGWNGPTLSGHEFRCVSRPESASPATGSKESHKIEQDRLMKAAFDSES